MYVEQARPYFIRKVNREETEHWMVFYVEDPIPPIELSVLIGDFLYNLRSALDSLICGLVRTRASTSDCDRLQFPIYLEEAKYSAKKQALMGRIPQNAWTVLDDLQPFRRPENTRKLDPLWLLNNLCNRDKHQSVLLTLCCHQNLQLRIPMKHGAPIDIRLPRDFYAGDVGNVVCLLKTPYTL